MISYADYKKNFHKSIIKRQLNRRAGKLLQHTLHKRGYPNGQGGQLHSSSEKSKLKFQSNVITYFPKQLIFFNCKNIMVRM